MLYLTEASYDSFDLPTLRKLFARFESRDPGQIADALAFVRDQPEYRRLAERRYLRFIQVRTRNALATLDSIADAALTEDEVRGIEAMDTTWVGLDEGSDPQRFFLFVNLAGAVVAGCFDFGTYVELAGRHLRRHGDLDHDNTVERHLSRVLGEDAAVYADGWFGRVLAKLTTMRIERVVFNHADARPLHDAMFLDEFIVYVNTYMADDVLVWDFLQSHPMRLTEAIYVVTYENIVRSQESDVAVVPPLPPFPHVGVFTGPDYAVTA